MIEYLILFYAFSFQKKCYHIFIILWKENTQNTKLDRSKQFLQ